MTNKATLLLGGVLLATVACQDDNLVKLDPNSVTVDNYFELEEQIESTLFAGYGVLQSQNLASRTYYFLNDLRGGEVTTTGAAIGSLPRLSSGSPLPSDGELNGYWNALYQVVHHANTTLDGIATNIALADSTLNRLSAEAQFLRGWAFNELGTHFGGVPLYSSVVNGYTDAQPRATEEETFDFAQSDLRAAADGLPEEYEVGQRGRATRGAALAILARSHMQQNDLAEADAALNELLSIGRYALVEDYGTLFEEENQFLSESIFEVVFADIGQFDWSQTGEQNNSKTARAQEYGPAWHNVQPTIQTVVNFRTVPCGDPYTDPRVAENILFAGDPIGRDDNVGVYSPRDNGYEFDYCGREEPAYPGVYKYGVYYKEVPGGFRLSTHNLLIARLADMLLLKAEIAARNGDDSQARDLINRVRSRVGNPPVETTEFAGDLVRAVQHERSVELAFEQVRFRDLKRWRDAGILPSDYELDYYEPSDRVLPIPEAEINNNPNISQAEQNDGY